MATRYFTTNADSGTGSLRAQITSAAAGDIIRPDESVFGRGATIIINLASRLDLSKNLTIDGGPCRIQLNGGGSVVGAYVRSVNVSLVNIDFVECAATSTSTYYGGGARADGSLTLSRCGVYGCTSATTAGGIFGSPSSTLTFTDTVVTGCKGAGSQGGVAVGGSGVFAGVTIVGNVGATAIVDVAGGGAVNATNSIIGACTVVDALFEGCVVDGLPSHIGFVAPPPDNLTAGGWTANAWQSWNLRLLDDAASAPSPYRNAGSVVSMTTYDLDGNFRGRNVAGVATCSPGAFETVQADLFLIGVASPSFATSDGWSVSRFATASSGEIPSSGQKLYVGYSSTFSDSPPTEADIIVLGGLAVGLSSINGGLTIGCGATVTVAGTLTSVKIANEAAITTSGNTALGPAVFAGDGATFDGVSVEVIDGVFFAQTPPPANVTFYGSGGWADVNADVTSVSLAVDGGAIVLTIAKNNANVAAFAQVSTNGGATWTVVPTSANDENYTIDLPFSSGVTARAAVAGGWLTDYISTAAFAPVWQVFDAGESYGAVSNAFEIAPGGSNAGFISTANY